MCGYCTHTTWNNAGQGISTNSRRKGSSCAYIQSFFDGWPLENRQILLVFAESSRQFPPRAPIMLPHFQSMREPSGVPWESLRLGMVHTRQERVGILQRKGVPYCRFGLKKVDHPDRVVGKLRIRGLLRIPPSCIHLNLLDIANRLIRHRSVRPLSGIHRIINIVKSNRTNAESSFGSLRHHLHTPTTGNENVLIQLQLPHPHTHSYYFSMGLHPYQRLVIQLLN